MRLAWLPLLLAYCGSLFAQDAATVSVTASACIASGVNAAPGVNPAGGLMSDGTFSIQATDGSDAPLPVGGGGIQATAEPLTVEITNGSIPNITIPNPAVSSPQAVFRLTIVNNVTRRTTIYKRVQVKVPAGSNSWDFCAFKTGTVTPSVPLNVIQGKDGTGFNPRGAWAANTAYAVNDIFTSGGSTYRVKTAFTSGTTFATNANMEVWAQKGADGTGSGGGATGVAKAIQYNAGTQSAPVSGGSVATLDAAGNFGNARLMTFVTGAGDSAGLTWGSTDGSSPGYSLNQWTSGNGAGLAGVLGVFSGNLGRFAWSIAPDGSVCFGAPVSGGNIAGCSGGNFKINMDGTVVAPTLCKKDGTDCPAGVAGNNRGVLYASDQQSTSGANDGIARSLAAANSTVVASPDYPNTELPFSSGVRSQAGFADLQYMPPSSQYGDNSVLYDVRPGSSGRLLINPADQTFWSGNTVLESWRQQSAGTGANLYGDMTYIGQFCCGKDENGPSGAWSAISPKLDVHQANTKGIHGNRVVRTSNNGSGDSQGDEVSAHVNAPNPEGAAEGGTTRRSENIEDSVRFAGTISAGAGTTQLSIIPTQARNLAAEGALAVVPNRPLATNIHISNVTGPFNDNPGVWTTVEAITPSTTIGRFGGNYSTPQLYRGGTTQVTFNMGITSGPDVVPGQMACIADTIGNPPELEQITSAAARDGNGEQLITMPWRYTHTASYITVGGVTACSAAEVMANEVANGFPSPLRSVIRLIGSYDAHHIYYSVMVAGSARQNPVGQFSTANFGQPSLTRTGNSVSIGGISDANCIYDGSRIRVSGASDTTFNGVFTVAETGCGVGASVITWTNTGTNGSASVSQPVYLVAANGYDASAINIMPAAEVNYVVNPTSHAFDGSVNVEAPLVGAVTGDVVEFQPEPNIISTVDHQAHVMYTPTTSSVNTSSFPLSLGGILRPGYVYDQVRGPGDYSIYQNFGGTKVSDATMFQSVGLLWHNILDFDVAPDPTGTFLHIGCSPLPQGCTGRGSHYQLFDLDGAGVTSGLFTKWDQPTDTLTITAKKDTANSVNTISPAGIYSSGSVHGVQGLLFGDGFGFGYCCNGNVAYFMNGVDSGGHPQLSTLYANTYQVGPSTTSDPTRGAYQWRGAAADARQSPPTTQLIEVSPGVVRLDAYGADPGGGVPPPLYQSAGTFQAAGFAPTPDTPTSGTGCGTHLPNSIWADDTYLYHCNAAGTAVMRAAMSAF